MAETLDLSGISKTYQLPVKMAQSAVDEQQKSDEAAYAKFERDKAEQESQIEGYRKQDTEARGQQRTLGEQEAHLWDESARHVKEGYQTKPLEDFKPQPLNTQEAQLMGSMMAAFAFIAARHTTAQMPAAIGAFAGMLKGYQQGHMEKVKEDYQVWKAHMDKTIQENEDLARKYKELLESDKLSIGAISRRIELIAQSRADFQMEIQARQGNIKGMEERLKETLSHTQKLKEGKINIATGIESALKASEQHQIEQQRLGIEQQRLDAEKGKGRWQKYRDTKTGIEYNWDEEHNKYDKEPPNPKDLVRMDESKGGNSAKATQQQFMAQRIVNASNAVASAIETIKKMPADTNVGLIPYMHNKDGLLNFLSDYGMRRITDDQSKQLNTAFTGVGRDLAMVEQAGGASGSTTLTKSLEKGTYFVSGDSEAVTAFKIADIKRIVKEHFSPLVASGLLPEQQQDEANKVLERLDKSIDFDVADTIPYIREGKESMIDTWRNFVHGNKSQSEDVPPDIEALMKKHGG